MLVSFEWLSDFLDMTGVQGQELAELMSRTGIEIESVINYGQDLSNLVVGQVLKLIDHPDSDHLHVAQVQVGSYGDAVQQIVCGAPNIEAGQKVMVALPGATLPSGVTIKAGKIRGQASNGMICSLAELGFPDSVVPKAYANGIYILPEDAPVGQDLIEYLQLDDPILELDITPNRADALSMVGSAYEIGAILDQKPIMNLLEDLPLVEDNEGALGQVKVSIEEDLASHYQLHLVENITVAESPLWLQMRLMKAGIRPINNIVDVTNYYLIQYGQPMHAFDLDTLPSKEISVARAHAGETFTTLDEIDRKLTAEDVLIKSGDRAIALAGVMGGLDSEVTDQTKNVLLETAIFNSANVRKTSRRLALRSESSARFEKGINKDTVTEAGDQAAGLMALLGQGQVVDGFVEENHQNYSPLKIKMTYAQVADQLGVDLSSDQIGHIFNRLNFDCQLSKDSFEVTVPNRRWDIFIQADILEEIARIYGYDYIPTTLPSGETTPGHLSKAQAFARHSRQILEGLGLNEIITYGLTSKDKAQLIQDKSYGFVELDWPMSEERTVLRQSMFPALMDVAMYNANRKNTGLAFYEIGRVFLSEDKHKQPIEEERLSILLSGQNEANTWYGKDRKYDFFDLKGMFEAYFETVRLSDHITYRSKNDLTVMHPGRTAAILLDGQEIGFFGQVHPKTARDYDLDDTTFFGEVRVADLIAAQAEIITQAPIPRFPETSRDIALLVDEKQSHASLVEIIKAQAGDKLVGLDLFDRYQGDHIAAGKQSLAYRLTFQDPQATLTDDQVQAAMDQVLAGLQTVDGLEIR